MTDGRTHYEGCEQHHHDCALVLLKQAQAEVLEQARLLDMSATREAAMAAELVEAKAALKNYDDRFLVGQPDMGGKYRWGGFNPGRDRGRSMEDDRNAARTVLSRPVSSTEALRAVVTKAVDEADMECGFGATDATTRAAIVSRAIGGEQ